MLIGFCAVYNLKNTTTVKEVNGLAIERRKLSEIVKAEWNPRKITTEQQAALQRSLAEFGTVEPIVINRTTGNVVGGHQRLDALLALGETETDVLVGEWTPEQEKALNIALNKISGDWDEVKLAELLAELQSTEIDIGLTGFSEEEIERMLFKEFKGETDADDVPDESQVETRCKRGDLWQLGGHRLLCGDSTNAGDIDILMGGEIAVLCITSPPYFNQREYSHWKTYDDYLGFARDVVNQMPLSKSALIGLNIGSDEQAHRWLPADWWEIFKQNGWMYQESFAWVKSAAVWSVPRSMHIENARYFPALRWEIILCVKRGDHPKFDILDRDKVREFQDNVWEIPVVNGNTQLSIGHPAMFPAEIPIRFITAYSQKGFNIYDPFLGSGTTLIACEQLGRRCFGLELEPRYCDVILARWEKFTGKVATLLENDTTAHQQERA